LFNYTFEINCAFESGTREELNLIYISRDFVSEDTDLFFIIDRDSWMKRAVKLNPACSGLGKLWNQ